MNEKILKTIEARARRLARKNGLILRKNRVRNFDDLRYGCAVLIDAQTGYLHYPGNAHDNASIDEILNYLTKAF